MSKNKLLKTVLVLQIIGLLVYTFFAFQTEGADLLRVFINNVMALTWSGQFNLDFLCYLTLSGLWVMWRNRFNNTSIIIGLVAMVLGILFFAPYLLWLMHKEQGDLKRMFIGDR